MRLTNFFVYLASAALVGKGVAAPAGSDSNAIEARDPSIVLEDALVDERDATNTLAERVTKVVSGKGVEFSVFPKGKVTWKKTKKPKWLPIKSGGKATRTTEEDKEDAEEEAGTPTIGTRAQKTAQAGSLATGKARDTVLTHNVKNCVAIGAYDWSTGKKVVAHINGIEGSKDYADQFGDFATEVYTFKGQPMIYIRRPNVPDFANALSAASLEAQQTMQDSIESWAVTLAGSQSYVRVVDRKVYSGDMIINPDGTVEVDS